jgi:hypothetical protein
MGRDQDHCRPASRCSVRTGPRGHHGCVGDPQSVDAGHVQVDIDEGGGAGADAARAGGSRPVGTTGPTANSSTTASSAAAKSGCFSRSSRRT